MYSTTLIRTDKCRAVWFLGQKNIQNALTKAPPQLIQVKISMMNHLYNFIKTPKPPHGGFGKILTIKNPIAST
jgi:hypothetical protein